MRRLTLRRPSPALIVSLIALFLAAGGTTYALTLPPGSVGPAQLRLGAVVSSRLYPGAVANSRMGSGAVTFSKLADHQLTAQKIRDGSLLGRSLAAHTITGAQVNVSTLGVTRFALVNADGTIATQSGGISVAKAGSQTILGFGSSVAGRPVLATLGAGASGLAAGQIAVAPCGGASASNPGAIACAGTLNSPAFVAVSTFDGKGAPAELPFYVAVPEG
jgi:hypothetical protein